MERRAFLFDGVGSDFERDLPDVSPEDNPLAWCERCQREHRKFTFTKQDWHTVRDEAVAKLAAKIDADAVAHVLGQLKA